MKIWTVTTDHEGVQVEVHCTEAAAEAQAREIVAAWYEKHVAADAEPRAHDDWRESYGILCETSGFWHTIAVEAHDISGQTDLAPKPDTDRQAAYTITDWLEAVQVVAPGMWENDEGPADWFAVCNDEGIIAYFGDEADAFRFRIDYINRKMNP